jgi:hypothetical protein
MDPLALLVQEMRVYCALRAQRKAVRQLQTGPECVRLPEDVYFNRDFNDS